MKSILIIAVLLFSAGAFAQDAPEVGNKPPVQVKPKGPVGCKPLGTVEGTQLWAGDCVANGPRRNEARRPVDARPPRGNEAREPVDARPPAGEKK
jgi:hypothetical protein